MEPIHKTVGKNLLALRKARGLSLEQAGELTGVSKAMLGQIERGDSNPTISVIWKIVNGLKISFTTLIAEESGSVTVVRKEGKEPLREEDGQFRSFPYFPFDQTKGFELYYVEMEPGCVHASEAHNANVEKYLLIKDGELTVSLSGDVHQIEAGSALRFTADLPHTYENHTDGVTTYYAILRYPE